MPFLRPTLTELRQDVMDDLRTAPGGDGMGLLRRAVSAALAWAIAQVGNGLYGHLDWISREAVPFTAEQEYLEAWAALVGVLRKPPAPFYGTFAGTGTPGRPLPIGTPLARGDGAQYVTSAAAVVSSGGVVVVPYAAVVAGVAGTMQPGDALTIAAGVAGVDAAGVQSGVGIAGADQETDDALRTRMLLRYAAPPQGGAASDYVEWALEVSGVTRAWAVGSGLGAGTVVVYTMWDDAEALHQGIPQGTNGVAAAEPRDPINRAGGDNLLVANAIYPMQPVTALVYAVAPVPDAVAIQISTLVAIPDATFAAIPAALDAVFRLVASPGGKIEPSPFYDALEALAGMPDFDLVAPSAVLVAAPGHIHVRGSVVRV